MINTEDLCEGLPRELTAYFDYIRSLDKRCQRSLTTNSVVGRNEREQKFPSLVSQNWIQR